MADGLKLNKNIAPDTVILRANPIRLTVSPDVSPDAIDWLNNHLQEMQAMKGVGFVIVGKARKVPTEIVLHPNQKPEVVAKFIEALEQHNIISEAEKKEKLQQLKSDVQRKVRVKVDPDEGLPKLSVNGHPYWLDIRASIVPGNNLYVVELRPFGQVSPDQLVADTKALKDMLLAGCPTGSVKNLLEIERDYGLFYDTGDVRARGANQLYVNAEILPATLRELLPLEKPAPPNPFTFRTMTIKSDGTRSL